MSPTTHTLFQCNPGEEISHFHPGEGRGGQQIHGEATLRGPTCYPFCILFFTKKVPFCVPSIDKYYSFHIPCLELCIPFY